MQVIEKPTETRPMIDISSWGEIDSSLLHGKEKKRFKRRKAAVIEYLTTDTAIEQIAAKYYFSAADIRALSEQCQWRHEDGKPWGYRALVPGAHVVDVTTSQEEEDIPPLPTIPIKLPTVLTFFVSHSAQVENQELPTDDSVPGTALTLATTEEAQQENESKDEPVVPLYRLYASVPAAHAPTHPAEVATPEEADAPAGDITEKRTVVVQAPDVAISDTQAAGNVAEGAVSSMESIEEPADQEVATEAIALVPVGVVAVEQAQSETAVFSSPIRQPRRYAIAKLAQQNRKIRKQWGRATRIQTVQNQRVRWLSLSLLVVILLAVLIPVGAALAAYSIYNSVKGMATDGIDHLLNVKELLPISKSDPMAALDVQRLHKAQQEFRLAEGDFLQLQQLVNRPDVETTVNQVSPDYGTKIIMARHLVQVALDVSRMGDEMSGIALIGADIIHGSPLASGSNKPLLSAADVQAIEGSLVHALYYINDIRTQMSLVQLNDLPLSDKQKTELVSALALLPKAQDTIVQAQGLVGTVSWLLGVGQARHFLVQTMDRGELRPSGGFTGQYGILTIQDGRMAPFSLRDVALLDYAGNGVELGRSAPAQYSSWMNFGNWGLRDSNLSADYPTTAQMSMQVFQDEGGGPVDGDISFTPTFIGHILDVTGPIHVAEYNETITSKNLEERLHYYQQNYDAIALERQKTNDNSHAVRKAFTSLVGKLLLDRVRHLPTKQLLAVIKNAVKDIQSRDLEIYFANPSAEAWLVAHGYSGAMDTFNKQDGFMVVQANISISKASEYVHTTEHDDVVLDAQGGATHNLTITLDYQQAGPVYGYDTYADYIRVYAPANAQLISGDGFDTGQCIGCCGPATSPPAPTKVNPPGGPGTGSQNTSCAAFSSYFPSDARYCPDGNYSLGDRNFHQPWKIDSLGAPTANSSDLSGRAMWGGLTETPKNCTSYIRLSWYVPNAVRVQHGRSPYSLLIQKQGGYIPTVEITVDDSALANRGLKPYQISQQLVADKAFSLPILR